MLIAQLRGRMARGGHGPGPALPYPSMPCGRATPETAVPLLKRPNGRFRGGRLLSLWTPEAVGLCSTQLKLFIDSDADVRRLNRANRCDHTMYWGRLSSEMNILILRSSSFFSNSSSYLDGTHRLLVGKKHE
jgi:hypothetical protein